VCVCVCVRVCVCVCVCACAWCMVNGAWCKYTCAYVCVEELGERRVERGVE
jgi:hypothetical protein